MTSRIQPKLKTSKILDSYKERIKRKPDTYIKTKLEKKTWPTTWACKGTTCRYEHIMGQLNYAPIKYLKSLKIKEPKIMILGSGTGYDILEYKEELKKYKISPQFDIFSLHKELAPDVSKTKVVKHDFSRGLPFEQIDYRIPNHQRLIKNTKGKYNLVISQMGVGIYTKYIATTLFNVALLLKPEGKAYIQSYDKSITQISPISINNTQIINPKSKPMILFNRFVEWINKTENAKYSFDIKTSIEDNLPTENWIVITRKS